MVFDDLTRRVMSEYKLFLFALSGRYMQAVSFKSLQQRLKFESSLYSAAKSLLGIVLADLDEYTNRMLYDASPALQSSIKQRRKEIQARITTILIGNIEETLVALKKHSIAQKNNINGFDAMGLLARQNEHELKFSALDKAGRRWDAEKLMRAYVRDFAYQSYLDREFAQLETLGDLGEVFYAPGSEKENAGMIFSLSGNSREYKKLSHIRSTIFHPNSNAVPKKHV